MLYSEHLRKLAATKPWYDPHIFNKLVSKAMARALGMAVPEVHAVFDRPDQIDMGRLPASFALKRELRRAAVLLVRDGVDQRGRPCTTESLRAYMADVRAGCSQQEDRTCRFFAEEYIGSGVSPNEHRFFVIDGKARFILIDFERFIERKQVVYTADWEKTAYWSREECFRPDHPGFPRPPCLPEMISFVERFAAAWPVPAAVVDLFVQDGKPVFGEAGIFHMAGTPVHPEWDAIMGEAWPKDDEPPAAVVESPSPTGHLVPPSRKTEIPMFSRLVVETQASCNRACPTCLRTTYPDRKRILEKSAPVQMPTSLVHKVIDDAAAMGFCGQLCLSFFNEPLLDPRLPELGRHAKDTGPFSEVYANTNGDLFDSVDVTALDGAFHHLNVAVYGGGAERRRERIRSLFHTTEVRFTSGNHSITHHSPHPGLERAIAGARGRPCLSRARMRLIVAYTGDMRLCCEDIAGEWDLGNVRDHSLEDLWFSPEHTRVLLRLAEPGGRSFFPYCSICPRR